MPVQVGQIAVEDQRPVVDHDHPATERLDVLEVVGGEQQRGAPLGVERSQELPQPALAHHVEADRRLVEVEDLGVVEQRRRDVAAHPLSEAQLAHRGVEQVAQRQQLHELLEVPAVARVGMRYTFCSSFEGVPQRQVPPERGALTEHHADPARQLGQRLLGSSPATRRYQTVGTGSRSAS